MVGFSVVRVEWGFTISGGSPFVHVLSDASGSYGCGTFVPDIAYFNLQWPPHWVDVDISIKELAPLVIACAIWGPTWSGQHVLFHVDNLAVQVVQHLNARDPNLCHFFALPLLIILHFSNSSFLRRIYLAQKM